MSTAHPVNPSVVLTFGHSTANNAESTDNNMHDQIYLSSVFIFLYDEASIHKYPI